MRNNFRRSACLPSTYERGVFKCSPFKNGFARSVPERCLEVKSGCDRFDFGALYLFGFLLLGDWCFRIYLCVIPSSTGAIHRSFLTSATRSRGTSATSRGSTTYRRRHRQPSAARRIKRSSTSTAASLKRRQSTSASSTLTAYRVSRSISERRRGRAARGG